MTIRVLVVDDSALIRNLLSQLIAAAPDMEVVGSAADAYEAREKIKALNPDVLTLDIEMPRMNGLEFLDRLMRARPMPVVMISTLTGEGSEFTLEALELGAVDFVQKPNVNVTATLTDYADELLDKIRAAHGARHFYPPRPATPNRAGKRAYALPVCRHPVCIGASTGGTEALTHLLSLLPGNFPALLITQHMPPGFTASFAARLDRFSALNVFEAQGGEKLHDGQAYLAPGGQHLRLLRRGDGFYTALSDEPPVNRHKPSVDVLFHSAVEAAGKLATGVILTGMGKDGAQGLLALRKIGAMTYGQDEDSCVVYGMPREAALIGAVQTQAPIPKIAALLEQQLLPMKSGGDG